MTGQSPSSQKLLFLSDVHLGGFSQKENDRIESELIEMIDYCIEKKIKLYVLGDLFDYWMEYPGRVPHIGEKLIDRFCCYNREFGPTTYITGNHDNWTHSFFGEIGFDVKNDFHILKLGHKNVLLLHGDGLMAPDNKIRRPVLHRILRNRYFVTLFKKITPPSVGFCLMKWYSRASRMTSGWHSNPSKLDNWAEQRLRETETDVIICGHDHIPREKKFFFGTYLNLGTFYKHRTVVLYNNDSLNLVSWNNISGRLSDYYSTNSDQT